MRIPSNIFSERSCKFHAQIPANLEFESYGPESPTAKYQKTPLWPGNIAQSLIHAVAAFEEETTSDSESSKGRVTPESTSASEGA